MKHSSIIYMVQCFSPIPIFLSNLHISSKMCSLFWLFIFYIYFFSLKCCDLGYHASLARTFRTYLSAEYNLETSRHEGLDVIENAVDNLDSRSDKHKIMDMHNQVFCPPMRFEYLPHMGDEVRGSEPFSCCKAFSQCRKAVFIVTFYIKDWSFFFSPQVCQVSAQQPVQTELLMRYHQLQSRLATLKIENEEVRIHDLCLLPIVKKALTLWKDKIPKWKDTSPSAHVAVALCRSWECCMCRLSQYRFI